MAFKMNPKSPLLMKATGAASPAKQTAKQKEQDPTQIPGNQVRSYSEGGSIKAPKVSYDMAYEKRDKKKYGDMKKADYIKEAKRQTKSKLETNDWDVNPRKKVKKTTTLKAEKIKTSKPKGNLVDAKEIEVTKKVTKAKPTRSQKLRAKGEAALASGNTDKAQRLRRRMDRVDARKAKRTTRKAAKQSTKMTPAEISKFEKNIGIQEKFDAKIEKAKGNTKKIERLTKRANRIMDRSAN